MVRQVGFTALELRRTGISLRGVASWDDTCVSPPGELVAIVSIFDIFEKGGRSIREINIRRTIPPESSEANRAKVSVCGWYSGGGLLIHRGETTVKDEKSFTLMYV